MEGMNMMNSIANHVEYLLRKNDCVVLPGFGAFLCNYVPAHFDERKNDTLLPPSRGLAFNQMITDTDGLLVWSVARKECISYEQAAARVREAIDAMWHELTTYGELSFGRLGTFYRHADGHIEFDAAALPSINGTLFGLQTLELQPVAVAAVPEPAVEENAPAAVVAEEKEPVVLQSPVDWRTYATGVVASLAVVITAVLFVLSPIKVNHELQEATIAPLPKAIVQEPAKVVVAEPVTEAAQPISVAPAPEVTSQPEVAAKATVTDQAEPIHFDDNDPFCVIVASFPTRSQADTYLIEHSRMQLGVLEQDSKYRIYAATGATYTAADRQRSVLGKNDAWICRR
jgi:hypothetical protein